MIQSVHGLSERNVLNGVNGFDGLGNRRHSRSARRLQRLIASIPVIKQESRPLSTQGISGRGCGGKCMSSSPRVLAAAALAGSQNWQTGLRSQHDLGKRDRASVGTCVTCLWNWWLVYFFSRDFHAELMIILTHSPICHSMILDHYLHQSSFPCPLEYSRLDVRSTPRRRRPCAFLFGSAPRSAPPIN